MVILWFVCLSFFFFFFSLLFDRKFGGGKGGGGGGLKKLEIKIKNNKRMNKKIGTEREPAFPNKLQTAVSCQTKWRKM